MSILSASTSKKVLVSFEYHVNTDYQILSMDYGPTKVLFSNGLHADQNDLYQNITFL